MAEPESNRPTQLTISLSILGIIITVIVGAVTKTDIPFIVYAIFGGVLLGVADLRRIIGGGK